MDSFISTLYVNTNSLTEEKICVALMLVLEDEIRFEFSEKKIKKLKDFLDKPISDSLMKSFKNMSSEIRELMNGTKPLLYDKDNLFTSNYYDYLHRYSNGLISFSEPKPVASSFSYDSFDKLYKAIIKETVKEKKVSFKSRVTSFISSNPVFKTIDINYKVNPELIKGIYAPHKLDFIGKNGRLIAGTSIDFDSAPHTLDSVISNVTRIYKGLQGISTASGLKKGEYELFFNPPTSKEGISIFNSFKSDVNGEFEFKEFEELEGVANKLEEKEYTKFSDFINEI